MNIEETSHLLAFVARIDNRRVDDATVVAWQSILSEVRLPDCLIAVRQHFRSSDAYLMPVHVHYGAVEVDRSRRRRERERLERQERLAVEADPTRRDRSEAIRELIAHLRESLPDGDPDKLRRAEWLEHDRRRARLAEPNPLYDPSVALVTATEEVTR
jgi:hypothetical protein